MASTDTTDDTPRRRRLSPDARKQEIIEAARPLFAQRPLSAITTADVAEVAGVSRALVHSYFGGGIRNVFLAVVAQSGAALGDVRRAAPGTPLDERLAINIAAGLDVVAENRETWWAVMGHQTSGDPQVDELVASITEYNVERTLANNAGLIDDTPLARSALRALVALSTEVTRMLFSEEITRAQAETLLVTTYRAVISEGIPALERSAANS